MTEELENAQLAAAINALCSRAYMAANAKGFHERVVAYASDDPRHTRHVLSWLMLITTEIAEAAEAVRKGKPFEEFEEELADACIRIFDVSGALSVKLGDAIIKKMQNNKLREFKHGKKC